MDLACAITACGAGRWGIVRALLAGDGTAEAPQATAENAEGSQAQPVLSVEVTSPTQDTMGNTLQADGAISAKDTASVSGKVSGVAIERVLVEVGDRVQQGQLLAVFDTDAMQQQVIQAEADLAEAEASLTKANADLARVEPLLEIDAISRQQVDSYRTAQAQAEASVVSARSRLNNQRLSVNNAKVVAPVAGVISERVAEVGMVANGESLFTIIKNGILEWQADISPEQMAGIAIGTNVVVSLPNDQTVSGTVNRIAPTADDNRQITVFVTLQPSPSARAGMYQSGEFILGNQSVQTIANSAIVASDGYEYVMQVLPERTDSGTDEVTGRIQQVRVQIGERLGDDVVLTEPLSADIQVVKQGGSFLSDGDLVRVTNAHQGASPSASQAASSQTDAGQTQNQPQAEPQSEQQPREQAETP